MHHVIPAAYYRNKYNITEKKVLKSRQLVNSDTNNFMINLIFCDHILAHYYLYMSAQNSEFKYENAAAVRYMLDLKLDDNLEIIEKLNRNEINKIYELVNQRKATTMSAKRKTGWGKS